MNLVCCRDARGGLLGRGIIDQFRRDRSGSYATIAAVTLPVVVAIAGVATEGGLWMYKHQSIQGAADSAAVIHPLKDAGAV
jgi:Flp pilus assembly protein TadG